MAVRLIGILTLLVCACLFLVSQAEAQRKKPPGAFKLTIGKNASAFHLDLKGKVIDTRHPNEHDVYFMQDILFVADLPEDILLREMDEPNAYALISRDIKLIVYNPSWVMSAQGSDGQLNHAVALFTLGHEIGHHACGHSAGQLRGLPWEKELQADRFAAAMIRKMKDRDMITLSLSEVQQSMSNLLSEKGSTTHPPISARLAAAQEGWTKGYDCKS